MVLSPTEMDFRFSLLKSDLTALFYLKRFFRLLWEPHSKADRGTVTGKAKKGSNTD